MIVMRARMIQLFQCTGKGDFISIRALVGETPDFLNTDLLSANNAEMLKPLMDDFSKTSILLELVKYWKALAAELEALQISGGEVQDGEIAKLDQVLGLHALLDGKPTKHLLSCCDGRSELAEGS